jgi:ribose transport system ATP-binding protein
MASISSQVPEASLRMRNIRKSFGATAALDGVDFDLAPGEVHALVGENGAGKSTLMKILSGAINADSGTIELLGKPFLPRTTHDARQAGIAMIYQELALAPHLSVEDNIVLGMEPGKYGILHRDVISRNAKHALAQLGHENIALDVKVGTLSPAAQQVVEIARALATGCSVLVLDEPTSSLSREDVEHLFLMIRRLKAAGTSIVYISHFLEEVKEISDRYTVLRDGRSVGGGLTGEISTGEIVRLMIGRSIDQLYPHSIHEKGEELLAVEDLQGVSKPRSASFALHRGEVLGIAGLIGAGRTELLRCIFGLDRIRNGTIRIGQSSGFATPQQRWSQSVGMVSENRNREGLALQLTIADNIAMNLRRDAGPLGFVSPRRLKQKAEAAMQLLGIRAGISELKVETLSGGNQQKVALARLLHEDVDIVILDEPTRGIDVASKSNIYALIDQLASGDPERNLKPRGVLVVSSYLPELLGICDSIAVMCRGVLGPVHATENVDQQKLLEEAIGKGLTE